MKRRVIFRFMAVILLTLLLVEAIFFIGVYRYYYYGIAQRLTSHAEISTAFYNKYNDDLQGSIKRKAQDIIKSFAYPGTYLELLDRQGTLIISSNGFNGKNRVPLSKQVLDGETDSHIDRMPGTGERVLFVESPLKNGGQTVAILRYTTSLAAVDRTVQSIVAIALMSGFFVLVFVFLLSLKLANSIVNPLKDIINISSEMAKGQFGIRMDETYEKELGELARTLNYMADEIVKNDRLKNEFISSISHELRTPLTAIKGWAETMYVGEQLSKEEMNQGIGIIRAETNRMIMLVEELLDFSKFMANRVQLYREDVRIDRLVEEVALEFKMKAEEKQCTIAVHGLQPVTIFVDELRLKQVLINIVDNAIKFSHQGGEVTVSLDESAADVVVKVSDRGCGIAADHLPHLTKSFYQVAPHGAGAGIGLAISDEIVRLHGGTLHIASIYGEGTCVSLQIPRTDKRKNV